MENLHEKQIETALELAKAELIIDDAITTMAERYSSFQLDFSTIHKELNELKNIALKAGATREMYERTLK